jgi:hypothetical protein
MKSIDDKAVAIDNIDILKEVPYFLKNLKEENKGKKLTGIYSSTKPYTNPDSNILEFVELYANNKNIGNFSKYDSLIQTEYELNNNGKQKTYKIIKLPIETK